MEQDTHISETEQDSFAPDLILKNISTLDFLKEQIKNSLNNIL